MTKLEAEGKVTIEDAVVIFRPPQDESILGEATASEANLNLTAMVVQADDVYTERDPDPERKKFTRRGGAIGLVAGLVLGGPIGAAVVGAGMGNVLARMKDKGIDKSRIIILSGRDAEYLHKRFPMGRCLAVLNKHEARQKAVLDMVFDALQKKSEGETCH